MRRTLFAETLVSSPLSDIDDYLRVSVIPEANRSLRETNYAIDRATFKIDQTIADGDNFEKTWRRMLNGEYEQKYIVTNPERLFAPIVRNAELAAAHGSLIDYLQARYRNGDK